LHKRLDLIHEAIHAEAIAVKKLVTEEHARILYIFVPNFETLFEKEKTLKTITFYIKQKL
jgi:hypothetical protein